MFWLQHQFNDIVETTQLTNNQMTELHYHYKCSKCLPPAPTQAVSRLEKSHSFVDRSLWQVAPDNLKRLLEFGDFLRLCSKLVVSLQHCTPTHDSPLNSYSANFQLQIWECPPWTRSLNFLWEKLWHWVNKSCTKLSGSPTCAITMSNKRTGR